MIQINPIDAVYLLQLYRCILIAKLLVFCFILFLIISFISEREVHIWAHVLFSNCSNLSVPQ